MRQRALLILESFAEATEQVDHLEIAGAAARCLVERFHSLWQPASY